MSITFISIQRETSSRYVQSFMSVSHNESIPVWVELPSEHCFLCLIATRGILMRVFIGVQSEQQDEKRQTKSCRRGKSLLTFTQMTFLLPADCVSVCGLSIMDPVICWPSVYSFLCSTRLQIFTVNQQDLRPRHPQGHQGVSLTYYDTQTMHLP